MSEIKELSKEVIQLKMDNSKLESKVEKIRELELKIEQLEEAVDKMEDIVIEARSRSTDALHKIQRIDRCVSRIGKTIFGCFIAAVLDAILKGGH